MSKRTSYGRRQQKLPMDRKQLEMRLESPNGCRRASRHRRRETRARWWFDQMKRVVDEANEWHPPVESDTRGS
jgi:hypothetical protein